MPAASRRRSTRSASNRLRLALATRASGAASFGTSPVLALARARAEPGLHSIPGASHDRRRQPRRPHPRDHPLAGSGLHRSGEAGRGNAPRLRHLSWLPPLLQSLRFLSAPVRPDRFQSEGRCRASEIGRFQARRRSLHALRHVLHDQMPLCAAASLHAGFPASDAAPPRRRGSEGPQGFHAGPAGRDGPQRHPGALCLAHRQLGVGHMPTSRCAP